MPDLRAHERLAGSLGRRDAYLWKLVITAGAYVDAVRGPSRHPNEDVARSLGVPVNTVRDRLHRARSAQPPLLTGGGKRGRVGRPELTPEAVRVSRERFRPMLAALGQLTERDGANDLITRFDALVARVLEEQATRMPGFWSMTLEELEERSRVRRVRSGAGSVTLEPTDEEMDLVDPTGA